jgi:hypothetical protein
MTGWKHKAKFGGLMLAGLVFTGIAVKRGVDSSERVQRQLNQIEQNTEHPAKITVNPPQVTVNPPPVIVKPSAPLKAKLQFSFWPIGSDEHLIDTISKPLVNGVSTVSFTAKNTGRAQAENGQVWIQICDGCRFAEEPEGTTIPQGDSTVRRKHFDVLHMGSYFEGTALKIIPPDGLSSFKIALKYSCEKCPPIDNKHPQKLTVNVSPP